jgi:hypothetical protein
MLKLRFTLGLALIGGIFTLIVSLLQDYKFATILYRAATSLIIFAVVGFGLGVIAEILIKRISANIKPKGKNIDIVSKEDNLHQVDIVDVQTAANADFAPLTPDQLEQVSRNKS